MTGSEMTVPEVYGKPYKPLEFILFRMRIKKLKKLHSKKLLGYTSWKFPLLGINK